MNNQLSTIHKMLTKQVTCGLVTLMSEKQQLSFKEAVVRQTIYYVSKQLPLEEKDNGERYFISLAHQWLKHPTQENAERLQWGLPAII